MAICSLIEDYGLVGFETLAVEVRKYLYCYISLILTTWRQQDKESMLNLMRVIDKATGCVFVPPPDAKVPEGAIDETKAPPTERPNQFGLYTTAMSMKKGPMSDPRDVQERWIDAKEEYDAYEKAQWRREGIRVQEEAKKSKIRERNVNTSGE